MTKELIWDLIIVALLFVIILVLPSAIHQLGELL